MNDHSTFLRGPAHTGGLSELRPFEPVSDALVLAAAERAERHSNEARVGLVSITEHLGFTPGRETTRGLRPQLERLMQAGALEYAGRGKGMWRLTGSGRAQVEKARRSGGVVLLPEAPQHRAWRQAHTRADAQIASLRLQVSLTLEGAVGLLADEGTRSDAWFLAAEHLRQMCRQLGSATYCSREWSEPHDGRADIDDYQDPGDEDLDPEERTRREEVRHYRRQWGPEP